MGGRIHVVLAIGGSQGIRGPPGARVRRGIEARGENGQDRKVRTEDREQGFW